LNLIYNKQVTISAALFVVVTILHPLLAYCESQNVIEPKMVLIPKGSFIMGNEEGDLDESPERRVFLSAFYLGKYEVTNEEFAAFLNDLGRETNSRGRALIKLTGAWNDERCRINRYYNSFLVETGYKEHPVIYVTWYGASEYCAWLSRKTGTKYRLPTEAEWEYAAGGGDKEYKYSWGDGRPIKEKGGNIADKSAKRVFPAWTIWKGYDDRYIYVAPTGSFRANRFGLNDMTGNVSEWCGDWYGEYSAGISTNPRGPRRGTDKVKRGGSWFNFPDDIRVTKRDHAVPAYADFSLGFRVARSAEK
jgi:sulfatase modifying factor 1